jgi:hypothetical protein
MSDRVSEFVSREEIRDLSRRYMRALDRLDTTLLGSVFADDATVDYGFFQGTARDFVAFAHGALKDHHGNHHLIGQMLVEVDGDTAVGEIYFQAYHRLTADGEEQELFIAGRYVDRYVRRNAAWKILFRSEVNDWTRTVPVADPFFQTNQAALRGARAPEDYSMPFFADRLTG